MSTRVTIESKSLRRTAATLGLAALFAGASLGAANAATRIGWVWANQPDAVGSYTPSTSYSYNSASGAVSITPSGPGVYSVSFDGLGSNLTDNVLVTAYETNGYCQVGSWGGGSGNAVTITVRCFDASGVPANSYFDLVYQAHSGNLGGSTRGLAFLWADQPGSASYTPSSFYQYNSTGGSNTITRSSTGVYTALLPGLTKVGGNVHVSAYGSTAARCKTSGWSSDGSGTSVGVLCFDSAGAPVDAKFTMEFSRKLPSAFLTAATTQGVYAWASQPGNASYQTSGPYSYNAFGTGKLTSVRDGSGSYHVTFSDPSSYSTSQVLVTAYGTDNSYCNSDGWTPLNVHCYTQGGASKNSRFNVSYVTH